MVYERENRAGSSSMTKDSIPKGRVNCMCPASGEPIEYELRALPFVHIGFWFWASSCYYYLPYSYNNYGSQERCLFPFMFRCFLYCSML